MVACKASAKAVTNLQAKYEWKLIFGDKLLLQWSTVIVEFIEYKLIWMKKKKLFFFILISKKLLDRIEVRDKFEKTLQKNEIIIL